MIRFPEGTAPANAPANATELLHGVLSALERPDVTPHIRCATLANALVASCKIGGVSKERLFSELEKIWAGLHIRIEGEVQ